MAVQPQTPYKEYTANGSTKSFSLGFDCENQDHLIVRVDDIEPVAGTWSLSGGAVVFGTAPSNSKKITIQRNTPASRSTEYKSSDNSFRPGPINKDFDRIWLRLQELGVADYLLKLYVDKQDAILKNYVDKQDSDLKIHVDKQDSGLSRQIAAVKTDVAEYLNKLLPMFFCIMRKEITHYTETELVSVIEDIAGQLELHSSVSSDYKYQANVGNGAYIARFKSPTSNGSASIYQSMVYDPTYNLLHCTRVNDSETQQMVIDSFAWGSGQTLIHKYSSNASNKLSHQALGFQYQSGKRYFWTRGGLDIAANRMLFARRVEYSGQGGDLGVATDFQIFPNNGEYNPLGYQCLAISPNYKIMVASATKYNPTRRVIRVFDLDVFTTAGNYSDKYLHEFTIPQPYTFDLQSIATDGEYIYTLDGESSTTTFGRVHVFTLDGQEVLNDGRMLLGSADATALVSGSYTDFWEKEGLAMLPTPTGWELHVLNMAGKSTDALDPDYNKHVAMIHTSRPYSALTLRSYGSTIPAINSIAAIDVAVPKGDSYTVAENTETGLKNLFNVIRELTGTLKYYLENSDSSAVQFLLRNNIHTGALQVSSSGNFGLYNTTGAKWPFGFNPTTLQNFVQYPTGFTADIFPSTNNTYESGKATLKWRKVWTQSMNVGGLVAYADNAAAIGGGLIVGDLYRTVDGTLKVAY